jgi:hypothetical protein
MTWCAKYNLSYKGKGRYATILWFRETDERTIRYLLWLSERMDTCHPDANKSSTTPTTKCEPCGYGYTVVCVDSRYTKSTVIFRGQHANKDFLKALLSERAYIKDVVSRIEPWNMTEMDKLTIKSTTKCHICDQLFTDEIVKVSDHCYVSGIFRRESCRSHNLNFKHQRFISIICRGLTNFESHSICSAMGLYKKGSSSCIAKSLFL